MIQQLATKVSNLVRVILIMLCNSFLFFYLWVLLPTFAFTSSSFPVSLENVETDYSLKDILDEIMCRLPCFSLVENCENIAMIRSLIAVAFSCRLFPAFPV